MKVVSLIKEKTGFTVSPDAMFDIQVISPHSNLFLGILMGAKPGVLNNIYTSDNGD